MQRPLPANADPRSQPILNSPYHEPSWHWPIDESGIAQHPAIPGRRLSTDASAVPAPLNQDKLQLAYGTQHDLDLVNELRDRVRVWRQRQYPGTTHVSRKLLNHWAQGNTTPRLFFAQLEAVETIIYVNEALDPGSYIADRIRRENRAYNDDIPRIAVKMATGTGKTAVIALTICWQAANHHANPQDKRYTDQFAVITPGITVRDRNAQDLIPSKQARDVYSQWNLIPNDDAIRQAVRNCRVAIVNFQNLQPRQLAWGNPSRAARQLAGIQPKLETPAELIARALPQLDHRKPILVLNDEGHHCLNSATSHGSPEDKAAADTWFNALRIIRQTGRLLQAIDYSATPFFITRGHQQREQVFPWTISDFPITDAIEAGMVKIPRLPVEDDSDNPQNLVFRNLYEHAAGNTRQNSEQLRYPLNEAVHALYNHYRRTFDAWHEANTDTPPAFIIVANDIHNSQAIFDYVSGYQPDQDASWIPGKLPLFSNIDPADNRLLTPPRTIIVHSRLDHGGQLPTSLGHYLKRQVTLFKEAYPEYPWADDDTSAMRQILNTVGKPGHPGQQVRCVVSVSMLTEGWDTRTVTHIIGFRKFGTNLLCEQTTGRSLRRASYDNVNTKTGLFEPEYSEILGIPFEFTIQPEPTESSTPKPTYEVYPLPERSHLRLYWPNVVAYQTIEDTSAIEDDLNLTSNIPATVITCGTTGEQAVINIEQPRMGTLIFQTAQIATELITQNQHQPHTMPLRRSEIFKKVARELHRARDEGRISRNPKDNPQAMRVTPLQLAQMLAENYLPPASAPAMVHVAVTDKPYTFSTGDVTPYRASREAYVQTDKSELNIAACDNPWEYNVALTLDLHPRVIAWARNDRRRWQIPYIDQGRWHSYRPDFIAKLQDERDEVPINLVIEVKGRHWPSDPIKARYARQYWIPAVNNHPIFSEMGIWQYVVIDEPHTTYDILDRIQA